MGAPVQSSAEKDLHTPDEVRTRPPARRRRAVALLVFVVAAAVVIVSAGVAATAGHNPEHPVYLPASPWLDSWARWDAGWYVGIAEHGYSHEPGRPSGVAFFPLYPLALRLARNLGANPFYAGIALTFVAGAASVSLFHRWCAGRIGADRADIASIALAFYPFSFFLVGAVYADGLFLALTLGAFVLLEHDRPWAAGLLALLAGATRPVGPAIVAGLFLRQLERRGVVGGAATEGRGNSLNLRALRPGDAGLLLAPLGFVAYLAYLWERFGDPLAFAATQSAPGWDQGAGPATWFKLSFFKALAAIPPVHPGQARIVIHAVLAVGALVLVPRVFRRLGWGYGGYALAVLALPAIASKDFTGMGRYILAAFPCFAVLPDLLEGRPRLAMALLGLSTMLLVTFTALFAQGWYLS